jgi:prepilin peptidase CpaA
LLTLFSSVALRAWLEPAEVISLWDTFILAFAITAAVTDVLWGRIPRSITTLGLFIGLLFHMGRGGFLSALLAAFLGFVAGLLLFDVGAIGGGDVKLIAALGALLGLGRWASAMEFAIFAAALIAIAQALRRGVLRQTLRNISDLVRWIARQGRKPHPDIRVGGPGALGAPFGVAAAIGTLLTVVAL